ncbi:protocadherin Fat 4-like [Mantella aurantiaca]
MDSHLKKFLLYIIILDITTLQQWISGDDRQLPTNNTFHLQGNQTTEEITFSESIYGDIFIQTAAKTKKPLSEVVLNTLNITSNKQHSDGPVFDKDIYRVSLLETSEINSLILQVKAKDKNTALLKYSISGQNSDYFLIDPLNGVILLAKPLEFNTINKYMLTAKAMDIKGYSSEVPVLIDVKDVDTMNPHFIYPLYEASVFENQKGILSTQPEEIKAIDGDIGINELVNYNVSNVHPAEYSTAVFINSFSGVISLIRELDRENVPLITVYIKATQQNNHQKSADSVVLITILDENDNPPQFSQSVYEASVPEHLPPGSEVLLLTASDKDEATLSGGYFLTNDTTFRVDKKGMMYLNYGEVDRELTTQLFVKVWVFDAELAGLNSSALVIITVTDINDNNPEFQNQSLFFTVPEGDYSEPFLLGDVNVIDRDAGLNGQTTVTSENRDNFIVQQNGSILVYGSLDREAMDRYVILLIAADNGMPPRKSFADLVIDVQDVNDNVPTFNQSVYSVHLNLSTIKTGGTVFVASAIDMDIGNNSQLSYRFANPHNGFTINEETGVISLTSDIHDICMECNISLIVIASDHGVPMLSSNATVLVRVERGSTEFLNSSYSFSIVEGMPPGTEIGTVQAYAGPDLIVMYSLGTYTETFSITDKGTILTSIILDREQQDSYSVMVEAVDSGEPPSTGAVVVTVTVLDTNDNVPVFSPAIHINVSCQENENSLDLGLIKATDIDTGNNSALTYLLKSDFDGIFHIDNSTGQLSNNKPLDRETTDSYEVTVIAQDSGTPLLSSTMIIHVSVQDVDDNPPIFEQSLYEVTVKENEAPHVILNVSAVDSDIGDNALIMYSFINVSHLFHIGEISGSLSNLQPLDFETSTQHVMTVTAYSPGNPKYQSTATVIVHVEDVNEQGPRVENTVYHVVIWDSAYTTGSTILDINATQGNEAVDEGIDYSISGDSSGGLFAISNDTGHIFVIKDLPPHHSPLHYTITVNCRDSGIPPLSTSIKVFVALSPINISYPVFSSDYYSPEALNDWTAPDTVLMQIKAFYLPAKLLYSFNTERDKDFFIMDTLTGIIRTKAALMVTDFPRNVTVKATDSQRFWIYSTAIVHVTVIHGNQWAPVFPYSLVKITVKEEQMFPTLITEVQATDADTDKNGIIQYSIMNDDRQYFSVNAVNGKIFALSSFDFENGPREFQIFILAEDHGLPQRKKGYCTIVVKVLDINDCKPIFVTINYMIVEENTPVGTFVGQVMATDQDSGDNAFILYSLNDEDGLFGIDGTHGKVFVKGTLDYETKQSTILNITATNNRTAPFYQTSTLLTVHILDKNDNVPQFKQKQYFAELDVDSPVGTLVTAVNASDRDQGDNGIIEYFLSPDMQYKWFLIENVRDGRIITAGKLELGEIIITVFAKDKGSPSLNSNSSVILNVVHKADVFPIFNPNELSTDLRKNENNRIPIYTFSAKDISGNNITYRIIAGNEDGQFYLDENTGELQTTEKFNYDAQPSYSIIVEAYTTPELQGPLPKNMARLQINLPDIDMGPEFEKQKYYATILNSLPPGFPIIKVTANDPSLRPNESLIYSLVNQSVEEFSIDKYTGQIKCKSVAGKTGVFYIEVQAMDPNGLFNRTLVQITIKSPALSHDDVEIKLNQTLHEVELHIAEIKRVLETMLQQKIQIVKLVSKNNYTIIRLQAVPRKRNQELLRKLKEAMPSFKKKMDEIFHNPVDVAIVRTQISAFNQEIIAGIVVTVLALCGVIAFLVYKRYKPSDNAADEESRSTYTEENYDNGTQSTMTGDNDSGVLEPKSIPAQIMAEEHQVECTVTETEEHQTTAMESDVLITESITETPELCTVIEAEENQITVTERIEDRAQDTLTQCKPHSDIEKDLQAKTGTLYALESGCRAVAMHDLQTSCDVHMSSSFSGHFQQQMFLPGTLSQDSASLHLSNSSKAGDVLITESITETPELCTVLEAEENQITVTESPCYLVVPPKSSPCYPAVPPTSSPFYPVVPPTSSPCYLVVPPTSSPCYPAVPLTSSPFYPVVPPTSSPCYPAVPDIYSIPSSALDIYSMLPSCAPNIYSMLPSCALDIYSISSCARHLLHTQLCPRHLVHATQLCP